MEYKFSTFSFKCNGISAIVEGGTTGTAAQIHCREYRCIISLSEQSHCVLSYISIWVYWIALDLYMAYVCTFCVLIWIIYDCQHIGATLLYVVCEPQSRFTRAILRIHSNAFSALYKLPQLTYRLQRMSRKAAATAHTKNKPSVLVEQTSVCSLVRSIFRQINLFDWKNAIAVKREVRLVQMIKREEEREKTLL